MDHETTLDDEALDIDALRTFVTGISLGSFARAAAHLHRSPSAVSAQLRKLEHQVRAPLVRKRGRGLAPTERGEVLLSYASRLLDLHAEALAAARGAEAAGRVRIGVQEDFADRVLLETLEAIGKAHPRARVEACVARNATLEERIVAGTLDLALTWERSGSVPARGSTLAEPLSELQMIWVGRRVARGEPRTIQGAAPGDAVPIVAFDDHCLFCTSATSALDAARIPWRLAFTSPSLSGLWAAAAAGIGVTVRTQIGLPPGLREIKRIGARQLPPLPTIRLTLRSLGAINAPPVVAARATLLDVLARRARATRSRQSD